MPDYMNYRVHVSFSSSKGRFEGKVAHMGTRQRVGFYDTPAEAEMFVRQRIEQIKSEKKDAKKSGYTDLSDWNRIALESRKRIIVKYGRGLK